MAILNGTTGERKETINTDGQRPPLGIMPEYIWKEKRLEQLEKVINDRFCTEFAIPLEWVTERNKLVEEVKQWQH